MKSPIALGFDFEILAIGLFHFIKGILKKVEGLVFKKANPCLLVAPAF